MIQFLIDNWLGLVLSSLAAIGVAIIWYAPPVFGNTWQKLAGIKDKDLKSRFAFKSVITLVLILVTAVVLKRFYVISNPQTLFEAMKVVVWIWLGFIVTYVVAGGSFEKVPYKLMLVDLVGQLLLLMAMGAVLFYY
jgi:membrane protease YdiL (CAAX protease family)